MSRCTKDLLGPYTQKRDFKRSPEPASGGRAGGSLFVVQHHWARRDHYDFRLELGGVLVSWAVTRGPSLNPADKRLAVRTEDHPLSYAEFEGLIPQGEYGGGTVMLWDKGVWEPISADAAQAIADGSLKLRLFGERMRGAWALVRMKPEGKRENWLLIKEKDELADREAIFVEQFETSVSTGRNRAEIEAGKPAKRARKRPTAARHHALPEFVPPCLCKTRDAPPSADGWLHEMKYDGYRLQAACSGPEVHLYTREGHDWTGRFPAIAQALRLLNLDGALIDGEAVVFDYKGLTDFPALVAALERRGAIAFVAFDILSHAGVDLRGQPLTARKVTLNLALHEADGQTIRTAAWHDGDGDELFANALAGGAEGIICKKAASPYRSGRSDSWLKVKGEKREDVVIVGYSPSDKRPFASLVAAIDADGALRYAGRIGGGFTDKQMSEMKAKLDAIKLKTPPSLLNATAAPRGIVWIKPRLRAEIALAGWTGDGQIRQGRFLGWREDRMPIPAKERIVKSGIKAAPGKLPSIRLTHPERVIFSETGLTKGGMADYYAAVANRILPHLRDRPVSFVRAPDGLASETFFQRHALSGMKRGIGRVPDPAKEHADYLTIKSAEGLMTAAQFSVIEFHGWGAVTPDLDAPDRAVFDLDPDEAIPFSAVRDAAFQVRDLLNSIGLESFAMATGGKGVHVIAPLDRTQDWEAVGDFTSGIARGLASTEPLKYVAIATKARRKGRIYIDWLRNKRSATAIVPWSLRARAQATVAAPVSWDELKHLKSPALSQAEVERRDDPWQDFFSVKQRLPAGALSFLSSTQNRGKSQK
ncbi:MAG: DNA ligase D [Chitinophagales bacterium]|nr:DNA ligase D [Hyphomicrobiales bacterium]